MDRGRYLFLVFVFMGAVAIILTVYDKLAAKAGKRRIPEKTLMLVAFFGGAVGMYGTMHLIRHKTKHKKFMVGLPVMILLHIIITVVILYFI
ncbi:MAG: DUF1294 domain-containing protein [Clostridia bacterium]|nr:DUF1294 domain-containing protein [Clostridia bacterium]